MSISELPQVTWRKSSLSGNGQNCVEIGLWRKSSLSGDGPACVEVTLADSLQAESTPAADLLVLMRDSKDPSGPVLAFISAEWDAFLDSIKGDGFEDLEARHEA
ncbi:DUF397 domain-containing protein [Streptosporangium sp. DT93]|uniref:DUF397 domain-containing protein n=1 Tax=Streptosporangium sp. DT93 TaxID=3393428 RepID=UPI003CF81294